MQTFLSVVFKYEEKINTFIDDLYKQKGKLIMRKKEISMIILAGGASSRMGRDKSDLTIDGKTFLEMQIEKGEKLGISDILLSGYHGENKYKYPIIPGLPRKCWLFLNSSASHTCRICRNQLH